MSWWDDINSVLQPVAQFIDPFADLIPGFQTAETILGIDPSSWGGTGGQPAQQFLPGPQSTFVPSVPQSSPGVGGVNYGQFQNDMAEFIGLGGDGMDFPLTTTRGMTRGLMPYQGVIPSGWHLKRLPNGRRGTPARAPGDYIARNRRMNPLNPRALARAERRMSSFTRYVKHHFSVAHLMPKRKSAGKKRRK
jgi:hypothetical protein